MFLIVFSLIVGFLGSVYATNYPSEPFASQKSVPTVLKISGNLNLNTTCTDCNLVVSVLNGDSSNNGNGNRGNGNQNIYTVVKNIHATDAQTIINDLNSGIFTNPFGYMETGHYSPTISLKVDVLNAGTSLVSTSVSLQNPSYEMGFLIADTVADGGITSSKLHDQSVGRVALDTYNVPGPGASNVLSYDPSSGQLIWNDFLSMITDGSITNNKLADNSVTSAKIADGTIQNVDIADNSITGAKINPGSINESTVAMRTYLKLHPQVSDPVNCDSSTEGLMYISRVNNGSNQPTFYDKICTYNSGTSTTTEQWCNNNPTDLCNDSASYCHPCAEGTPNCWNYFCTTTTGNGYNWMDIN